MNISVDLSMYKKNTKKHPVYKVPEVKIQIFEDIPRVHVSQLKLNFFKFYIFKFLTDKKFLNFRICYFKHKFVYL